MLNSNGFYVVSYLISAVNTAHSRSCSLSWFCCSGFNATLNFTLPPLDVSLARINSCTNVSVNVLDGCPVGSPALLQSLTIINLRYSFVNTSLLPQVKASVQATVAEAAGIPLVDIAVTDLTDVTKGTAFKYLIDVRRPTSMRATCDYALQHRRDLGVMLSGCCRRSRTR